MTEIYHNTLRQPNKAVSGCWGASNMHRRFWNENFDMSDDKPQLPAVGRGFQCKEEFTQILVLS
jgi:hypothetical protein